MTRTYHTAIVSVGSNIGDGIHNIQQAYKSIQAEIGEIKLFSSFYESTPWGFEAEQNFVNSVIVLHTHLSSKELLKNLKKIEQQMGRVKHSDGNYHSRIIDLDVVDFDGVVINENDLIVPHPRMLERCFVLQPLLEILPNYRHPLYPTKDLQNCVQELECSSNLKLITLKDEGNHQ